MSHSHDALARQLQLDIIMLGYAWLAVALARKKCLGMGMFSQEIAV